MQKLVITLGIWVVAAAVLLVIHWPAAPAPASALTDTEATATAANAERGKALFMAKGCATCHNHAAVGGNSYEIGPNLTYYQANPEFLQQWLRNPQAIRPNTQMPNLNLQQDEIGALIAFLATNQPRP